MNKAVSEYLDGVCSQIKSKNTRLSTRSELSGHIRALIEEVQQTGIDENEAAKTALQRMGDPHEIGKQIAYFNAPWQNVLTTIVGAVLLLTLFIWQGVLRGTYLFDPAAFAFVVLLTLAIVLIGGLSRLTRLSALTRSRTAALYAGGIGVIIGVLDTLGSIGDLHNLGVGLSFCITSALYGLIVSAVLTSVVHLCRPLEGNEIRKILGWGDLES